VTDLKGQLANAIDYVLNTAMPKKWAEYFEAYVDLRNACAAGLPLEPPPPKPPTQRPPHPDDFFRSVWDRARR
jgi:hypothetical protein